jgi:hypothetical protein
VKNQEIQRTVRNAVVLASFLLLILAVSLYIGYRLKAERLVLSGGCDP